MIRRTRCSPVEKYGLNTTWPPRYVYFAVSNEGGPHIKIGLSEDVPRRMKEIKCTALATIRRPYNKALDLEQRLHAHFAESRRHGEWFMPTPELISLIEEHRDGR